MRAFASMFRLFISLPECVEKFADMTAETVQSDWAVRFVMAAHFWEV